MRAGWRGAGGLCLPDSDGETDVGSEHELVYDDSDGESYRDNLSSDSNVDHRIKSLNMF